VVYVDTAFDQHLLHVAVGKVEAQIPPYASTMTSGAYRNPANADTGGDHARVRADFTDQVSLDLANA
jgi:hypothetical protein